MKNKSKKILCTVLSAMLLSAGVTLPSSLNAPNSKSAIVYSLNANAAFSDVKETDWFYDAVMFVQKNQIMSGMSKDKFGPNEKLTRGQFVTVLYNMAKKPEIKNPYNPFKDVKKSDYYYDPVIWAIQNNITNGTSRDKFSPNELITREQVAVMLYQYDAHTTNYRLAKDFSYIPNREKVYTSTISDKNSIDSWAVNAMEWAVINGIISGKTINKNNKITSEPLGKASRAECAQMIKNYLEFSPLQQRGILYNMCKGEAGCTKDVHEVGCGLMSTINAVRYLNGKQIDIKEGVEVVKRREQYIHDEGGKHSIAQVIAGELGYKYGFRVSGTFDFGTTSKIFKDEKGKDYREYGYPTEDEYKVVWKDLVSHLSKGEVAVTLVHGHFIAIVDYDALTGKVLVYDSAASPTRGTTAKGDNWKSFNDLNSNKYFILRSHITYLARS